MKMQSMSSIRQARQAGFTLIELIVVIVILGILAATALPKFVNLGTDARLASITAARGSIESGSAMAHGRFLISGGATATMDGAVVDLVNGYPAATAAGIFAAAGITSGNGYTTVIANGTASAAAGPVTVAGTSVAVFPTGVADARLCHILYTAATATTSPPTITPVLGNCA